MREGDIVAQASIFVQGHAHRGRDFITGRSTTATALDIQACLLYRARGAMQRTRRPVAAANFIEHRTANTNAGKRGKTGLFTRLVTLPGLEQTDRAGLDQVFDLNTVGQTLMQPPGDTLDQLQVLIDDQAGLLNRI